MNVNLCTKKMETIIGSIQTQNEIEKLQSYGAIVSIMELFDDLAEVLAVSEDIYHQYKTSLLWHCQVLCGLEEAAGLDEASHVEAACEEIRRLKSVHCFNCN